MTTPKNCLRGIPNHSFLQEGTIGSNLFYFPEAVRVDGWKELSINWQDDDEAVNFTLSQVKEDGEFQFKAGVVVIPRDEIDKLNNKLTIPPGSLSYERQPIPQENLYHGNILLLGTTPKRIMKLIAAGLTLAITQKIIRE